MNKIVVFLIKVYRIFVSPLLVSVFGKGCKYEVSCSEYCLMVFKKYDFSKALSFSLRRLFSCHSF